MFRQNHLKLEENNGNGNSNAGGAAGANVSTGVPGAGATNGGNVATGAGSSATTGNTGAANIANVAAPVSGASGAATGGNIADTGGVNTSWLESLPEEIKKDPALAMFKDPASLAKSWVNAQKMIGADKVVIPGANATEEELGAFYNKIGRPQDPTKYELKPPQGYEIDPVASKALTETAHKLGLTNKQLAGIIEFDAQRQNGSGAAYEAAQKQAMETQILEYQKSLGGEEKYRARVNDARSAVQMLTKESFRNFLVETKLGSHPEAIEFFAELKGMMGEGKIRDGAGTNFGVDPSVIQAEINSMMHGGMDSAYFNSQHPGHHAAVEKVKTLNERLVAAQSGRIM